MKIFFDTNVLIAAFITRGACGDLFEHCMDKHIIYISDFVLSELHQKLIKKFKFPENKIIRIAQLLISQTVVVKDAKLQHGLSRDKDDDFIIAAAVEGQVF